MRNFDRSHLADATLLANHRRHDTDEYGAVAENLADLGEIDARRLYLAAAYPTMVAWCIGERNMREQKARKRLRIAQTARQFPALLDAVADGRLHLSAALLLLPWLTEETAEELIASAANQSLSTIERMLAERARRPIDDTPSHAVAKDHSDNLVSARTGETVAPALMEELAPQPQVALPAPRMHVAIGPQLQEKLRYAQQLLSHRIRPGQVEALLERAVDLLIRQEEKAKFGATARPRRARKPVNPDSRHVPDEVKWAVWQRDGGRCTFTSDTGHRCEARSPLEFDHIVPYARGGSATVDNLRLRCRAHNLYDAERTYGAEFMKQKRGQAQRAAEEKRAVKERAEAEKARAARQDLESDVIPWLRSLRFSAAEAKRGAAACAHIPGAPLEERIRVALTRLARAHPQTPRVA